MTVTPSAPKTAHAFAYEAIRDRILAGDLGPGDTLVQATLANELGISMTPVREALRDLANEGLVSISTHRGAFVSSLDIADAREIHRIRLLLEPDAVRLAVPNATPELLDQAEALIEQMRDKSGGDWVTLNFQFHGLIISPAESPRLLGMLRVLHDAARRYVGVALKHRHDAPPPEDEHRRILTAYRAGDAEEAAAAIADHIHSSLDSFDTEDGTVDFG